VARNKRDLAAGHSELRSAGPTRRERCLSLEDFVQRPTKVEINLAPGLDLEHQDEFGHFWSVTPEDLKGRTDAPSALMLESLNVFRSLNPTR
jgi:hypothetical protein